MYFNSSDKGGAPSSPSDMDLKIEDSVADSRVRDLEQGFKEVMT